WRRRRPSPSRKGPCRARNRLRRARRHPSSGIPRSWLSVQEGKSVRVSHGDSLEVTREAFGGAVYGTRFPASETPRSTANVVDFVSFSFLMLDLSKSRRSSAISALVTLLALVVLARAVPVIAAYAMRFRESHGDLSVAIAGVGLFGILGALAAGIRFWPRATALALSAVFTLLVVTSGNSVACVTAAIIFAVTLLAGDALS